MKTLPLVFATLLAGSMAATTHATSLDASEIRKEVVSFADLDLSQSEDAEVFYRRIKAAAHDVCGAPGMFPLSTATLIRACARDAIERALTDVNVPSLNPYRVARMNQLPKDEQR